MLCTPRNFIVVVQFFSILGHTDVQLVLLIKMFEILGRTDVQLVLLIKMFETLGHTDVHLVLLIKMFEILGRTDVQILAGELYLYILVYILVYLYAVYAQEFHCCCTSTDVHLVLLIKMFEILGRTDVQILAGELYLYILVYILVYLYAVYAQEFHCCCTILFNSWAYRCTISFIN